MTGSTGNGKRESALGAPLGPGSLLWTIAGDPRSLISGSAAGIMQLMLPGLGAGVSDHSDFFDDPYDRIFRSIPLIWRSIFTVDDDADDCGRQIRDFHTDIKGTDHHGNRYHALDPDVYWWAHATFTWEFFRAWELFLPGLRTRAKQEQLYAETVTWYRRYGVSERAVPPTLADFRTRFADICANELELTPAVQWVLDPATNPGPSRTPRFPGPFSILNSPAAHLSAEMLRVMVFGSMPDALRRRFEFPWSNADRATFSSLCLMLQNSGPAIRRGFLAQAWPKCTPHLDPNDPRRVVIAGQSSAAPTGAVEPIGS